MITVKYEVRDAETDQTVGTSVTRKFENEAVYYQWLSEQIDPFLHVHTVSITHELPEPQ